MPRPLSRFWMIASTLLVLPSLLPAQATAPVESSDAGSVRVLYTGKLFGYFRVPDAQPPGLKATCPDGDQNRNSVAVGQFRGDGERETTCKVHSGGYGRQFCS